MPISRNLSRVLITSLVVLLAFTACSALPAPTKEGSALSLMPNVGGYNRTDTKDVQGALANLAAGSAALTGNVQFSALIKIADRYASCYRNAGAFEAVIYTNQSNPILTGAILIINNGVASNPAIFLTCLNAKAPSTGQSIVPQPCTNHYTLPAANNSYEIMYVGSDTQVCTAFCSALQGCTR